MGNSCAKKPTRRKKAYKLIASKELGLENLGNSCYINSVLHSLQGIPRIYSTLSQLKLTKQKDISYSIYRILKSLNENQNINTEKHVLSIKKVTQV